MRVWSWLRRNAQAFLLTTILASHRTWIAPSREYHLNVQSLRPLTIVHMRFGGQFGSASQKPSRGKSVLRFLSTGVRAALHTDPRMPNRYASDEERLPKLLHRWVLGFLANLLMRPVALHLAYPRRLRSLFGWS